jgi:hypothetical protein
VRSAILIVGVLAVWPARVAPAAAQTPGRVAVQPIGGTPVPSCAALRLLREHGYRALTSIPGVEGTGQYLTLARDHRLAAFVASDLEEHRTRQTLTMLIWDGAQGAVLDRWSVSGPPRQLGKLLAKGFWKHLGPALERARAPEPTALAPAPPMRIDAGDVN